MAYNTATHGESVNDLTQMSIVINSLVFFISVQLMVFVIEIKNGIYHSAHFRLCVYALHKFTIDTDTDIMISSRTNVHQTHRAVTEATESQEFLSRDKFKTLY